MSVYVNIVSVTNAKSVIRKNEQAVYESLDSIERLAGKFEQAFEKKLEALQDTLDIIEKEKEACQETIKQNKEKAVVVAEMLTKVSSALEEIKGALIDLKFQLDKLEAITIKEPPHTGDAAVDEINRKAYHQSLDALSKKKANIKEQLKQLREAESRNERLYSLLLSKQTQIQINNSNLFFISMKLDKDEESVSSQKYNTVCAWNSLKEATQSAKKFCNAATAACERQQERCQNAVGYLKQAYTAFEHADIKAGDDWLCMDSTEEAMRYLEMIQCRFDATVESFGRLSYAANTFRENLQDNISETAGQMSDRAINLCSECLLSLNQMADYVKEAVRSLQQYEEI